MKEKCSEMKGKKSKRPLLTFVKILITLSLIVLAFWALNLLMPLLVHKGNEVAVPNLIGMTEADAEKTIVPLGLKIGTARKVPHPDIPIGRVVAQYPRPGRKVKVGREIDLDISAGANVVKIPNLEGLPLPQAITALERAGFVIARVESIRSANVPAGRVAALFPPAGTEVRQGTEVVISVSTKTGTFPMPNLVGLNIETARGIIASHGMVLGQIKSAVSTEPLGTVLFQYPEEGMPVISGDTVSLIVATDSNPATKR